MCWSVEVVLDHREDMGFPSVVEAYHQMDIRVVVVVECQPASVAGSEEQQMEHLVAAALLMTSPERGLGTGDSCPVAETVWGLVGLGLAGDRTVEVDQLPSSYPASRSPASLAVAFVALLADPEPPVGLLESLKLVFAMGADPEQCSLAERPSAALAVVAAAASGEKGSLMPGAGHA